MSHTALAKLADTRSWVSQMADAIACARLDDDDDLPELDAVAPTHAAPTHVTPLMPRRTGKRARRSARRGSTAKANKSADDGPAPAPEIAAFVSSLRRTLVAQALRELGLKGSE